MSDADESSLLAEHEGPAVQVQNATAAGPVVLVCEHASRFIPAALNNLGLDDEAAASHAAWDIGALDLAEALMRRLNAPLVSSRVSRLVYDCNRPPEAPDAAPARSEKFSIPGNEAFSEAAMAARVREIYLPFRAALAATLADRDAPALLVTIHSFTPVYMGKPRQVELGLLHDADASVAQAMLRAAPRHSQMKAALNEPYAAKDGVTHTLKEHGKGIANVMIEIRNDLIDTPDGVRPVADELAAILRDVIAELPTLSPEGAEQLHHGKV